MEFNRSLDKLDKVVKIILAAIPVVNIIWVIYAIIRDQKNTTLLILDIVFGLIPPVGIVFYVGNIVTMATKEAVLSFAGFINGDPIGDGSKKDNTIDAEVVDK